MCPVLPVWVEDWRFPHRPDADALGEAVVRLDVVVELRHGLPSQIRAVVGLVHVQHHWNTAEQSRGHLLTLGLGDIYSHWAWETRGGVTKVLG